MLGIFIILFLTFYFDDHIIGIHEAYLLSGIFGLLIGLKKQNNEKDMGGMGLLLKS